MDEKFFLKKIQARSICVFKKSQKKIRLQDVFHLENNEIVTSKISRRPDFQDEYVLMFAEFFT